MTSAHEVVDLCESTPSPRPVRRSASLSAKTVIDLEGDDNLLPRISLAGKKRRRERSTDRASRLKTDPNERTPRTPLRIQSRNDEVEVVGTSPPAPELEVLHIFPDAEVEHVKELLNRYSSVHNVVNYLVEHSYPTAKAVAKNSPIFDGTVRMETNWKYDFMSVESFKPNQEYIRQAVDMLCYNFPFLSLTGVQKILARSGHHYAISHDSILKAVKETRATAKAGEDPEETQYKQFLDAISGKALSRTQVQRLDKLANNNRTTLKTPRKRAANPSISDATLLEEVDYVNFKLKEWSDNGQKRIERRLNREASKRAGTAMVCSCCFDEAAIEDMVACRAEGHLFCVDCLRLYAENQVFGSGNLGIDKETNQPALELKCFHGDGCSSGFARSLLVKALPQKTLRKYDDMQFQISVEKAGLDDLCSCPKCGFQAAVPQSQKVFQCPVVHCRHESCRDCGKSPHIPLRCDEVEKDKRETAGRVTVEEAITAAKVRLCPKCSKPFVKSEGCNKIRCACGVFVCYICRQQVKDYTHFCQKPHCQHDKCNKCALFTNAEQDDARAMREAGIKAAARVHEKSLQTDASKTGVVEVAIDVESILKDPTKAA